jgi:hypothetical protein
MRRLAFAAATLAVVAVLAFNSQQGGSSAASAQQRSDRFWAALGIWNASWGADYPSLASLVDGAHVVVRGRLTAVTAGRTFGSDAASDELVTMAQFTLQVDERIKWDDRLAAQGTLNFEVVKPNDESIEDIAAGLPAEESVFFLRNRALAAQEEQRAPDVVAQRWPFFQQVNNMGVFREIEGMVQRPPDGDQTWLDKIDGTSYPDFVDTVRTLATSQSTQ